MDPYYNHRVDEYGGSVENRMRLPLEIIRGIKAVCGEDYPVLVKVNSNTRADDEQYGEQLVSMVRMFAQAGAQAVELSGYDFAPKTRDRLYFLDRAAQRADGHGLPGGFRRRFGLCRGGPFGKKSSAPFRRTT